MCISNVICQQHSSPIKKGKGYLVRCLLLWRNGQQAWGSLYSGFFSSLFPVFQPWVSTPANTDKAKIEVGVVAGVACGLKAEKIMEVEANV